MRSGTDVSAIENIELGARVSDLALTTFWSRPIHTGSNYFDSVPKANQVRVHVRVKF